MKTRILLVSALLVAGCSKPQAKPSSAVAPLTAQAAAAPASKPSAPQPDANGMYPDGTLAAGHSAVDGHVVDAEGNPLVGARVKLTGTDSAGKYDWTGKADTGTDGCYRFFVPPGTYKVTASMNGYIMQSNTKETHSKLWRELNFTLVTVQQNAAETLNGFEDNLIRKHQAELSVIVGRRFRVAPSYREHGDDGPSSLSILQEILSWIPRHDYVDELAMYKILDGLDGSSRAQALAKLQNFIGKYYVLQGDVFQIQADRNYPRTGRREFTVFGNVKLIDSYPPYYVPTTVLCLSAEKVPPYRMAPILGKIVEFRAAQTVLGRTVIVPVVWVSAVASITSFSDQPSEIIINRRN